MIPDEQYRSNRYTNFHLKVARLVQKCIECSSWDRLAYILKKLNQDDREALHYAFFDLYGFDYDLKIRRDLGNFENLKRFGLVPDYDY